MNNLVIKLFLRRYQIDSAFVFSVMNYNKLNFDMFVENDLTSLRIVQSTVPEAKELPLLLIMKDKQDSIYTNSDNIMKQLKLHKLLTKGVSYSAWEDQSLRFIKEEVQPLFESINIGFLKRFKQCLINLYSRRGTGQDFFSEFFRILNDCIKLSINDRKKVKYSAAEYTRVLENWEQRLQRQDFHGGKTPDLADFLMLACVDSTFLFSRYYIDKNYHVKVWKIRMDHIKDQNRKK